MSVEDLKRLFADDPDKMSVGRKGEMVRELVKMVFFEYTLETEVRRSYRAVGEIARLFDSSSPSSFAHDHVARQFTEERS